MIEFCHHADQKTLQVKYRTGKADPTAFWHVCDQHTCIHDRPLNIWAHLRREIIVKKTCPFFSNWWEFFDFFSLL